VGFFYGQIRVDSQVKMAIPLQKGQGKVKQIKVEGEWEKEEGVIIHYKIGSRRWKK